VAARAAGDRVAQPALGGARRGGQPRRRAGGRRLRGLGDDLAAALADLDMRVRIYCPVGDMVAGMAYLVRRLLENTANESFLSDLQRGVSVDQLLAAP
jgi:proline dehydrogenase